ncbi:MAG: hypothetical protein M1822_000449 [Bathelium mastoideum]|nr:MAG: hypothetical protein M1822_000449 [Bathelium mastoideum]
MSHYFSIGLLHVVLALLSLTAIEAISLPDCQTVAPQQKTLTSVHTSFAHFVNAPFGIIFDSQKDVAFAALVGSRRNSTLGVLDTSTFTPHLIRQIPLPVAFESVAGVALTHDGQHILLAANTGGVLVDAARAIVGSPNAVVGTLNGITGNQTPGDGAIEVTVSLEDDFAFVSQEYGSSQTSNRGDIDVFRLHKPTANGSITTTAIGYLVLGHEVVGTTLSPDGSILYATSEGSAQNDTNFGTLSVIDVETLKTNPSKALLSTVLAGCSPVRTIVSSDGKTVWVTARASNHLLAFDAEKLVSEPSEALLASVQVGTLPVGLTFARNETRILTADSDRFNYTNATSGLSVVDVDAALAGQPSVLGRIPTGLFPREVAISPNGRTILVSDILSKEIQAIDVATLP